MPTALTSRSGSPSPRIPASAASRVGASGERTSSLRRHLNETRGLDAHPHASPHRLWGRRFTDAALVEPVTVAPADYHVTTTRADHDAFCGDELEPDPAVRVSDGPRQ